jgi:signal transduction histidine kinase
VRYIVCGAGPVKSGGQWKGERLRALTSVPLEHKGAVVGALNLGSHGRAEIPAQTRVVIETIAAQAAGAIARIRAEESLRESEAHLRTLVTERFRLEGEILEISDREKGRIGQDIHDGLCQQLVGAAFDANSLQKVLEAHGRPEAATARTIYSLLDEAITESRRVSRGLYPVRLETEGLAPALQELATNTSERFNIPCSYEPCAEVEHCEIATATHLYRIAQEAVNNAVKHSGAKSISIGFSSSDEGVELEIRDDGKGLSEEAPRGSGMGLHIMDYRAKSIGASLRVRGTSGGTIVSCRLPKSGGRIQA